MKQISTIVQIWDEEATEVTKAMGYDAEKMSDQFAKYATAFLTKMNEGKVKNVFESIRAMQKVDETFFQFIFTSGLLDFFRNTAKAAAWSDAQMSKTGDSKDGNSDV